MKDPTKMSDEEIRASLLQSVDEDPEGFVKMIQTECRLNERFSSMDERELLWWLCQSPMFKTIPIAGPWAALRDAIETRLYPEYDGELVKFTDLGWSTPQGDINYVKEPLP